MTTHDPSFDDQVRDALVTRLDTVSASTDLTGPAIARAGAIRRRRRTAAAASAALATVAVAAPFVWWNVRGTQQVTNPATSTTISESATTTPPPTTSSTPPPTRTRTSPAPTTSAPAPRTVPTGDADAPRISVTVDPNVPVVARPDLPHILDTTLHRGGESMTFDVKPGFDYLPLARGRSLLIERGVGGSDVARIVGPGGTLVAEIPAKRGQYLFGKVNDAGTLFALMDSSMQGSEPTATLSVFDEAGAPLYSKRNVLTDVRIAGFVGKRVFLGNYSVNRSYVWDLERDSIDRYTDSGVVVDVHEKTGRAAFYPKSEYQEARCSTISNVTGAKPRPISVSCGLFQPKEFSPDGRYLLGIEVPGDGMLQSPSRVIDVATGRAVVAFDEARPLDIDSGFLPDGSVVLNLVLGQGTDATRNALLRCTLDGTCTRLVDTVPMPDFGTTMAPRYRIVRE